MIAIKKAHFFVILILYLFEEVSLTEVYKLNRKLFYDEFEWNGKCEDLNAEEVYHQVELNGSKKLCRCVLSENDVIFYGTFYRNHFKKYSCYYTQRGEDAGASWSLSKTNTEMDSLFTVDVTDNNTYPLIPITKTTNFFETDELKIEQIFSFSNNDENPLERINSEVLKLVKVQRSISLKTYDFFIQWNREVVKTMDKELVGKMLLVEINVKVNFEPSTGFLLLRVRGSRNYVFKFGKSDTLSESANITYEEFNSLKAEMRNYKLATYVLIGFSIFLLLLSIGYFLYKHKKIQKSLYNIKATNSEFAVIIMRQNVDHEEDCLNDGLHNFKKKLISTPAPQTYPKEVDTMENITISENFIKPDDVTTCELTNVATIRPRPREIKEATTTGVNRKLPSEPSARVGKSKTSEITPHQPTTFLEFIPEHDEIDKSVVKNDETELTLYTTDDGRKRSRADTYMSFSELHLDGLDVIRRKLEENGMKGTFKAMK